MKHSKQTVVLSCMVLTMLSAVGAFAAPPTVVETVPRSGDLNVDPALQEMRFVFDQDMSSGGYSICGGGRLYPRVIGRPRWADKRTLVARVQLEPDHEYQLSINSPSHKNCRNVAGEPAVPYPVRFRTAGSPAPAEAKTVAAADNARAIRNLREAIDTLYSYRDLRKLDWAGLFTRYTPALERAKSPQEFAQAAAEMLSHAQDMHIWLEAGGQQIYSFRRAVEGNYNRSALEKAVPGFRKRSAAVYTGRFDDGIGYILIDSWSRDHTEALEQAYEAIWEFSDAPGLIVDVRPNGGGAEPLAQDLAGCFIDKPVVYAKHVYRAADQPSGFSEPRERVLPPNKRRPKYRGKIVVLMGPANMSSCEAFLLMMKQVPGCRLIGASSYGSSGNPKPTDLGNGVTVYLSSWKSLRPDGTCFEGEGIAPDFPIKATQTEFKAADLVLQAALTLLRRR